LDWADLPDPVDGRFDEVPVQLFEGLPVGLVAREGSRQRRQEPIQPEINFVKNYGLK
jgi:hypothetical protein